LEGVGVKIARNNGRTGLQVIQQKSHLPASAAHRRENFKMRICHRQGSPISTIEADDQCVSAAFALFRSFGRIVARRQEKIFRIDDQKARQGRVPLNGRGVLAGGEQFFAGTFREFLESPPKNHLHPKPLCNLKSNATIPGASHAIIHFIQAQNVRRLDGLACETFFEKFPTLALLDVPGHKPNALLSAALIIH
jgi:hypothetical protein